MNIPEMRERALAAVDASLLQFESSLPPGESDEATVIEFLKRRREEIVAAARGALHECPDTLPAEVVLRLLYREVSDEEFSVLAAE